MTEETRTTRLTILIAGNAFVLSKSYDLIVSAIKATHFRPAFLPGYIFWIVLPFIGMTAAYLALRPKSLVYKFGEALSMICIGIAMLGTIASLIVEAYASH